MTPATALCRLTAATTLGLSLGGCFWGAHHLDPVRREVQAAAPRARIDPGIQLHFGRLSMALARSIVRAAAEDEDARQAARLLEHVNGVEVAVYGVEGMEPFERRRLSEELARLGARRGWHLAARFADEGGTGSVHFQHRGDAIRSIWIFAFDDESLVMARLRGDLDRALAEAIAATGGEIPATLVAGGP